MKLIKIVGKISDNFNTPLTESVTKFFPRDNEKTIENEFILVSDSKFRLLELANVRMHVYKEFSDTVATDIVRFQNDDYYLITKVIKPSEFDEKTFDPSVYNEGDLIFFYKEGPVKPEEPEKPKFHEGTFNYELTPEKKKEMTEEYKKAYSEYETALEEYNTELKTFMETEGDLPIFGCLGLIINPIMIGKKLEIICDVSFETTKTESQFGILGKMPKSIPSKVGATVGGLKKDVSIKGKALSEILTTVLGLEEEEEIVGTIQSKTEASSSDAPTE